MPRRLHAVAVEVSWYGGQLRGLLRGRCPSPLLRLADALCALGDDGVDDRRFAEVPLADVVGTLNRPDDFDREFRLLNRQLQDRWAAVACAVEDGREPPAVELIQVGEIYFVVDGHHRVSVARSLRRDTIPARVLRLCTTAYAPCCLRPTDLAAKAAERRFLERVPLPVRLRSGLWLEPPAQWSRVADAAEAWGFRRSLREGRLLDRCELAESWWAEDVVPAVEAYRRAGGGAGLSDVQVYARTLDGHVVAEPGPLGWPPCPGPATWW